ncbi:MAG: putative Replication factor C subunit 3 [Streblomastix strix]|uniref:Putative Replication factor C subunit 3 n=1 Tax=Streblomastix strix TaxID=222440 RepID=A0A5J4X0T0_9EUKA|nr:MAG: putative Replication factor C subunit 3 [Streblomastix strix]
MALLLDKTRPTTVAELDFNVEMMSSLKAMLSEGDFPHILFYGPPGCGKKTRIQILLRTVFGPSVDKIVVETRQLKKGNQSATFDITLLSSPNHVEVCPSDAGMADRYVVMELIKEVAQSLPLDLGEGESAQRALGRMQLMSAKAKKGGSASSLSKAHQSSSDKGSDTRGLFKVVVLTGADLLSKAAQHALRRTMEKYMSTCRLVLVCETTSKIISPLLSRCLLVRCASPTDDDIVRIVQKAGQQEHDSTWRMAMRGKKGYERSQQEDERQKQAVPQELAQNIAVQSHGNVRRALLMLDACLAVQGSGQTLEAQMSIPVPDWEIASEEIATMALAQQDPKQVLDIRKRLYELLVNCIPADVLFKRISQHLNNKVDGSLKEHVAYWAAFFEHRCQQGMKPIIHLEAFITKIMALQKEFLTGVLDQDK